MLTMCRQQHSFSPHKRMFLWKCQSFWDRKCLDLRGTQTPNLRIHGDSYRCRIKIILCTHRRHLINSHSWASYGMSFVSRVVKKLLLYRAISHCDGASVYYSNLTWALRCLKSPATRMFVQQFLGVTTKETLHHWPFVRGTHTSLVDSPHKVASNTENISCHGSHKKHPISCTLMQCMEYLLWAFGDKWPCDKMDYIAVPI